MYITTANHLPNILLHKRVYCEYNSLHDFGKEKERSGSDTSGEQSAAADQPTTFDSPEDQLLHFMSRAGRPRWKWMSVRPRSPQPHHGHGGTPVGQHAQHMLNAQTSKKSEPYYCDRPLVQTLVRDAMVTDGMDRPAHPTRKEDKQ